MLSATGLVRRYVLQCWGTTTIVLLYAVVFCGTAQGRNVGTPIAHWGGYQVPESEPTRSVSLQSLLVSEFDKQPVNSTRRGPDLLAPRYGALEGTYGLTLLTYSETGHAYLDSDRRHPNFLYSIGAVIGMVDDTFTSFLQNQFVHNVAGYRAVPRDGDPVFGTYLSFGTEFNYFLRDSTSNDGSSGSPFFIGSGLTSGSFMVDPYFHAGLNEYRPLASWGDRFSKRWPKLDWLFDGLGRISLHGVFRSGYVRESFMGTIAPDLFPGPSKNVFKEFYTMFQAGFGLQCDYASFRVSFTGTTGIFVGNDEAGIADREIPVPENFLSYYVTLGSFWWELVNDFEGGKDRGPSFGTRMGFSWPL